MYKPQPFSYLAPNTGQAAPKTGYRKEEGIYGDLTASVTGINQQQPASTAGSGVSGGNGMPPPVAAKPMVMRHDRPSGFDADWRLRGSGGSDAGFGEAPKPAQRTGGNNATSALYANAQLRVDPDVGSSNNDLRRNGSRPVSAERPSTMFPPSGDVDVAAPPTYESAADLIRAAAVKNQNAADRARRDQLQQPALSPDGIPARTPTADDDFGGGIFDNFILVGPSGRTEDVRGHAEQPAAPTRELPRTKLEDVFGESNQRQLQTLKPPPAEDGSDSLGSSTGYVVTSAAATSFVGNAPSNGGVVANGGQRPERLPRLADGATEVLGSNGKYFDGPNYQLYSGAATTADVATAAEPQQSPFTDR